MSAQGVIQSTGNIELHIEGAREVLFLPGARWRVESGYTFEFIRSGNFEIHNPAGTLVWESGTGDQDAAKLVLRPNGDLAIYASGTPAPLWHTNTAGNPGAFVAFQQDGNFVVYDREAHPLWASDSVGK
ncbi:MAG TPA: hypothetical protein VHU18_04960 [Rhizomicrobium sp.]|jgi:hypothetical protein|nr:hypothetical protein [Rhizomicrobium sp.]